MKGERSCRATSYQRGGEAASEQRERAHERVEWRRPGHGTCGKVTGLFEEPRRRTWQTSPSNHYTSSKPEFKLRKTKPE